MAVKLGVGGKLLLIMTSTISLILVVAVTGIFSFEQVANKQNSVIDDTIPAIVTSHSLSLANSSLVNMVPSISKVTTLEEVAALSETIDHQLQVFLKVADSLGQAHYLADEHVDLSPIVKQIDANLRGQLRSMKTKLEADEAYFLYAANAAKAISQIESISTSLVANANTTTAAVTSGLYDLVDADQEVLYEAFDRLIDIDLDHMERMYELRKRATALNSMLSRLSRSSSAQEVEQLEMVASNNLSILRRRIGEINDPGRREQAIYHLQQFELNLQGDSNHNYNLFNIRRQAIQSSGNQQALASGVKGQIDQFNKQVIQVSRLAGEGLRNTTTEARMAVSLGRDLVLYVSVAIVVIGILFLWLYLRRSLLAPLDRVNDALLSVAKGDLSVQVSYFREDEIGRLSRTVQVFKDNASVRQELEQQQEIVERRLRNYQNELEQQIQQRTLQLQSVNERLESSVENHQLARLEAEQASQAKTAFLATMSHEIRTPLSGILGTLRLLEKSKVNEQQQKYVGHSLDAANALLSILNGILDYAKVETDQIELALAPCHLVQITSTLWALMQPVAEDKGIELSLTIEPGMEDRHFMLDKGKVHQVLFNLVSNAIKFTALGSVKLSIMLLAESPKTRLRFELEDTGLGIPPERREQLFQPFTQYDASTSRRYGGTGLGLSICRKLVEAMGGGIGIQSREADDYSKGSCCWFELPCEMIELDASQASKQPRTHLEVEHKKHILLVEDNEIGRIVAEGYLLQMGHSVECAVDGYHALEYAEQEFDVILMDISMPGMDGVETATKLRSLHQQSGRYIPIIAMSAHIFPQEIEEFLRAGLDGFIGKPIDFQRFMLLLQDVKKASNKLISLPDEHQAEILNEHLLLEDMQALGKDKMAEMISLYEHYSEQIVASIKINYNERKWLQLADAAHSLKNAAGSLGLEALHGLANQLESKAKHKQVESVGLIMDDLSALVNKSKVKLQAWQRVNL